MPKEMRSDDRVLVLKKIPGQETKSSTGLIDNRLFNGGNNLHIVRNRINDLWGFKYDDGAVPPVLRYQKFTSFPKAYKHAERYLSGRGLQIVEVIDQHAED